MEASGRESDVAANPANTIPGAMIENVRLVNLRPRRLFDIPDTSARLVERVASPYRGDRDV